MTYTCRLTVRTPIVLPRRKYRHTATALPRSSGSNTRTALPTDVEPLPAADRTATYTHTRTRVHTRTGYVLARTRTTHVGSRRRRRRCRPVTNPSPCTRIPDDGRAGDGGGTKKIPYKDGGNLIPKSHLLSAARDARTSCAALGDTSRRVPGRTTPRPQRRRAESSSLPVRVVVPYHHDYYRYYYCCLLKLSLLLLFFLLQLLLLNFFFLCFQASLPVCLSGV